MRTRCGLKTVLKWKYGPHLPEVRVGGCGYCVTAWRTTCLYGVTYSRASPRLTDGAPSSVSDGPHLAEVRVGECGYRVTAWRTTCLYGVTYSRASPRLFAYITSLVSGTDRTSPTCEWRSVGIVSPHGALRAYTVLLTAEPRRGSSLVLRSQ